MTPPKKNPKVPSPGLPSSKNISNTNNALSKFIATTAPLIDAAKLKDAVTTAQKALDDANAKLKEAQKNYNATISIPNISSVPITSFKSESYPSPGLEVTLTVQTDNRIEALKPVFVAGLSTFVGLWQVKSLGTAPSVGFTQYMTVSFLAPLAKYKIVSQTAAKGTLYFDKNGGYAANGIGAAYTLLEAAKAAVAKATAALDTAKKAAGKLVSSGTGGAKIKDTTAPTVLTGSDTSPVTYNIPSVTEAYFSSSSTVDLATARTKTYDQEVLFVDSGNRPAKVTEAQALWMDNQAHKGMFQTFIVPKADATKNTGANTAGVKGRQAQQNVANVGRYGFQFLYNPGTISMDYAGAPNVDPGLMMSNQQMIPLIGASNTSSSVSFNLILNRMPDMKYLTNGSLDSSDFSKIYGTQPPADYQKSLDKIRDSGTMYDVEFLLQTLLGYEAWSTLRNRYSSDIGYIGSFPVELHLGKSLRYIVLVQDITVTHTIFTKDMIPVYSNISIMAGRLPDSGFNTLLHSYKAPSVPDTQIAHTHVNRSIMQ